MKILFVDDDTELVELTSFALGREGHFVVAAHDSVKGLERWRTTQPDLILLAMTSADHEGTEMCRQIRALSSVPIIVLGPANDEEALLHSYECGADDYIMKPFSIRQLLMRIDVLMRRTSMPKHERTARNHRRVAVGDLVVDMASYTATKMGTPITLTRLEFYLLYYLARHAGTLVEAQELADFAWHSPSGGDITLLKTHVSHIRQKLEKAGGAAVHIRAVPRTGYMLSLELGASSSPSSVMHQS